MHCESPNCALVCPADAIKRTPDGVVQTSLKPRCLGCTNCVLACPFGVPEYDARLDQMMKCDMCYDRTSVGKPPACVTACPTESLFFGPMETWRPRRHARPVNHFRFGRQDVATRAYIVMPDDADRIDVRIADILIHGRAEPTPAR